MRKNDPLSTDEELAQLTDLVLNGDKDLPEGDLELRTLTETVQRLHAAFDEDISPEKTEKIRRKITANWRHKGITEKNLQPKKEKWFSWTSQRRYSMVASMALLLIFIVMFPALFTNTPLVIGSAGVFAQKTLLFAIIGLILVAILIWMLRKK